MKKQLILILTALSSTLSLQAVTSTSPQTSTNSAMKPYVAKDYSYLIGMSGFSDTALENHFKLYQGYVKNANLLLMLLQQLLTDGKQSSPEYAELKRRLGWEFDGMRLHEFYFENLGEQKPLDPKSALYTAIVNDFGSYDKWQTDFIATGAMRGIGWAVLYQDPQTGRLTNMWINEHDVGHLAGGTPLLIMDVFEHAYMPDYQLDRMAYIQAFFRNINWQAVVKRYQAL